MTLKLGIVLCLAASLYIAALQPEILGFYHDDGVYAVTAKALAEGKGYRIISLPGEPVQMTYPIFYPLVLSVVWRIFPEFPANIPALKAPSIIFALLFLWITYQYLVRRNYASKRMALAIVFMTAVNPWTVWAATMAMSEALYCLVSVLALWATELFISSTWGSKRKRYIYLALAGMVIAVTIMTRSIGISVLSATFIFLFLNKRKGEEDRRLKIGIRDQGSVDRRQETAVDVSAPHSNLQSETLNQQSLIVNRKSRDRRSRKSSLLKKGLALGAQLELSVMLFLTPWMVWTVLQYIHQTHLECYPYRPVFYGSYSQYLSWQWQDYGILFFLKSFVLNIYRCFLGALPNMILQGVDIGRYSSLNFLKDYLWFTGIGISGIVLSVLALFTLVKDIAKIKPSLITVYIIFILIITLLWPIEPDRFLLPLLPFIFLFFMKGFSHLAIKFGCFCKVLTSKRIPVFSVSILLIFVIFNSGMAMSHDMANIINARKSEEWIEKRNIFHWVNRSKKNNDILVTQVSAAMYLYTGLKAVPPVVGIDFNNIAKPSLSNDIVIENFRNLLDYAYDNNLYLVKIAYRYPPIYEQMIDRLAIKYPDRISLVYTGKNMDYAIYKMR